MDFEWDEAKSESCFKARGFDTRHSYGEDRYQLTGQIQGRLFVVIYTPRRNSIRLISARKANLREVRHYEDSKAKN